MLLLKSSTYGASVMIVEIEACAMMEAEATARGLELEWVWGGVVVVSV